MLPSVAMWHGLVLGWQVWIAVLSYAFFMLAFLFFVSDDALALFQDQRQKRQKHRGKAQANQRTKNPKLKIAPSSDAIFGNYRNDGRVSNISYDEEDGISIDEYLERKKKQAAHPTKAASFDWNWNKPKLAGASKKPEPKLQVQAALSKAWAFGRRQVSAWQGLILAKRLSWFWFLPLLASCCALLWFFSAASPTLKELVLKRTGLIAGPLSPKLLLIYLAFLHPVLEGFYWHRLNQHIWQEKRISWGLAVWQHGNYAAYASYHIVTLQVLLTWNSPEGLGVLGVLVLTASGILAYVLRYYWDYLSQRSGQLRWSVASHMLGNWGLALGLWLFLF